MSIKIKATLLFAAMLPLLLTACGEDAANAMGIGTFFGWVASGFAVLASWAMWIGVVVAAIAFLIISNN